MSRVSFWEPREILGLEVTDEFMKPARPGTMDSDPLGWETYIESLADAIREIESRQNDIKYAIGEL